MKQQPSPSLKASFGLMERYVRTVVSSVAVSIACLMFARSQAPNILKALFAMA